MKKFLEKISKNFLAYVAWLLVVIVLWVWIFSLITRISPQDKVTLFLGTYSDEYEETELLQTEYPDYLKKVEVFSFAVDQMYFDVFLQVHGYEESDIFVLPERYLSETTAANYYAEISPDYRKRFENLGFYAVGEKVYGLKVYDKETHESAIDFLDYGENLQTEDEEFEEENYYLLFSKYSYHLGDLSGETVEENKKGAITIAEKLLTL